MHDLASAHVGLALRLVEQTLEWRAIWAIISQNSGAKSTWTESLEGSYNPDRLGELLPPRVWINPFHRPSVQDDR